MMFPNLEKIERSRMLLKCITYINRPPYQKRSQQIKNKRRNKRRK